MPFKTVKTKSDRSGWRNLHALVMFGKETARFDIKPENDEDKDRANQQFIGTSIRVDNDNLPQMFQNIKPGTVVDDVYVLMDTVNAKAIAINPWNGTYDAICYELGSNVGRTEDNRPQFEYIPPEDKRNRYQKEDLKKFFAAYEILEDTEYAGIFKGAKPRYHLQHNFVDDGNGMVAISEPLFWKGRRTNSGKLMDWTIAHEIDSDMEYPADGNCLPEEESRILQLNKPVRIHIQNGWIADVSKARGASIRVVPEEETPADKPGEKDPTFGD